MSLIRRLMYGERGFTTVTIMGVLMVGGMLVAGAIAAAEPDIKLTRKDQDTKQSYAAAEAGLNYYLFHLSQDNNYWAKCTSVPPPSAAEPVAPVNQRWDGAGADPRVWRTLPGSQARYTVELLPANGATCDTANAAGTMIDAASGTFRIRATGEARGVKRSLIATFKRRSFLDYLYFTDYETSDPATYADPAWQAWASDNCQKYHRDGRSSSCTPIQFAPNDAVRGPFHTNDEILTCGTPDFGRTRADAIEVSAPDPGYRRRTAAGCDGDPNFLGTWTTAAPLLSVPPSNSELKQIADLKFTDRRYLEFRSDGFIYSKHRRTDAVWTQHSYPANGVLYVESSSCAGGYTRKQQYGASRRCGDAYIKGTFTRDITIAADNDIIVEGNFKRSSDQVAGLIANNFVRIYHPVSGWSSNDQDCDNTSDGLHDVEVQAAMLALNHSFIVDNYYCGAERGTLTVFGAIAQRFRGPVGTSGGGGRTGYIKSYNYDDRLRYHDPPHFLDPIQSSWRVSRQNEQLPPR